MSEGQEAWERACLALKLLAADPQRMRGLTLRCREGPVRDVFLEGLARCLGPSQKLHPAMSRDALLGGLDFVETLARGKLTHATGLLARGGTFVLTMAERCSPEVAALVASALDTNPKMTLILLDEGAEADEAAPRVLTERLAFQINLDGVGRLEASPRSISLTARPKLRPATKADSKTVKALTVLSLRLGIHTMRAPKFAVDVARVHAELNGRSIPNETDMQVAAELVLATRATQIPETDMPPETPDDTTKTKPSSGGETIPEDMLIDSVRAIVPPDLLENLRNSDETRAKGSGAGQRKKGNRRGRPLPARPGRLDGSSRLDLVATLRAAAPWQALRNKVPEGPLRIFPSDIHLKRYEDKSDRLIVFAVDASGSAALARLGEAKGAVELLLSRAYATRDHVALIAFRGEEAQVLLPPTRSLVQTKRRLADLPGGGGTPLAHGLQTAAELAIHSRAQGLSPLLAILTDGRANIALDGRANRDQANGDARAMARWIRAMGVPAIVLDLGTRPHPSLSALAQEMDGKYTPLPRGTAERMSETLESAMDHGLGT